MKQKLKILPKGWKEIELGQVCKMITRGKSPNYVNKSAIKIINQKCIYWGKLLIENVKFLSENKDLSDDFFLRTGDLLINSTGTGTLGRATVFNLDVKEKYTFDSHVTLIRPNENLDSKYFSYILMSSSGQGKLYTECVTGSTNQIELSKTKLSRMKVTLPPLPTQKAIVSILEKAEKLKQQRAEADKLTKEYLQSVFYEMFMREKFEEVKLGEVAKIINGRAYKREELLDEGHTPVLRVGNFFSNRSWYYSNLKLEDDKYCDKGDLLYAWSASFGPRIWHGPKAIYHYHIWKMVLSGKLNKMFMLYLLQQKTNEIKSSGHGITMIHITKSGMERMKIPLPPIALQNNFAAIVEKVETLKEKQKESHKEIENLFNSLIQKAFNGELVK